MTQLVTRSATVI
jgi:hypothetical protein